MTWHDDSTNKFNFLVREGVDVVLVDFERAERCFCSGLEEAMKALEKCLADKSYLGGIGTT